MKKITFLFGAFLTIISCTNGKKEKPTEKKLPVLIDSNLVTDSAWGPITSSTDYSGLQTIYGTANIKDEPICGPECIDSIDVTKVFPDTEREITVYWRDSLYHKSIVYIESHEAGSPYRTATGLKIGSTMKELLKINGQKISFNGFGWDYGGYIQSYNNGSMDKSPIGFRMDIVGSDDTALLGDIELHTDMPTVKNSLDKIVAYQLSLTLHKDPLHEH